MCLFVCSTGPFGMIACGEFSGCGCWWWFAERGDLGFFLCLTADWDLLVGIRDGFSGLDFCCC